MTDIHEECVDFRIGWSPIVNYPVEAIVNSSNDDLFLGTGTSSKIAQQAGPDLKVELDRLRQENGKPFALGSVIVTSNYGVGAGGKTRFLFHAVSMGAWQGDGRILATPETVFITCANAAGKAADLGLKSIVFPMIACRAGYSTLRSHPASIRWAMATAMILGIRHTLRQRQHSMQVWLNADPDDSSYIAEDIQMLRDISQG